MRCLPLLLGLVFLAGCVSPALSTGVPGEPAEGVYGRAPFESTAPFEGRTPQGVCFVKPGTLDRCALTDQGQDWTLALQPVKGITSVRGRVSFSAAPGPQIALRSMVQLWQDGGSSRAAFGEHSVEFRFDDVKAGSPVAIRVLSLEGTYDGAASAAWYLYPQDFKAEVTVIGNS